MENKVQLVNWYSGTCFIINHYIPSYVDILLIVVTFDKEFSLYYFFNSGKTSIITKSALLGATKAAHINFGQLRQNDVMTREKKSIHHHIYQFKKIIRHQNGISYGIRKY